MLYRSLCRTSAGAPLPAIFPRAPDVDGERSEAQTQSLPRREQVSRDHESRVEKFGNLLSDAIRHPA